MKITIPQDCLAVILKYATNGCTYKNIIFTSMYAYKSISASEHGEKVRKMCDTIQTIYFACSSFREYVFTKRSSITYSPGLMIANDLSLLGYNVHWKPKK